MSFLVFRRNLSAYIFQLRTLQSSTEFAQNEYDESPCPSDALF